MQRMIFINLPVTDLRRSEAFYAALGWSKNTNFSDDTASCMVWSDVIHVMLLTHDKWRSFCQRDIPDAHRSAQVLLCLSLDTRQAVDDLALVAGQHQGTTDANAPVDYGFMRSRSVADPDGHIWELMWMDPAAAASDRGASEA